jgi:hypothetical protein
MELWQFYRHVWEAERALKAAVPTAWLVKGGVAFAVVKFPREPEPGERWAEKMWVAVPWVFGNGLFGIEVVFEDARFTAVACLQHDEGLAAVEEMHVCAHRNFSTLSHLLMQSLLGMCLGGARRRPPRQAPRNTYKLRHRPHAATYVFDSALETRSKSFANHTASININVDIAI